MFVGVPFEMKLVCVRSRSHFWCSSQEKAVNRSFREDSTPDMLLEWLNKKVPKQDSTAWNQKTGAAANACYLP